MGLVPSDTYFSFPYNFLSKVRPKIMIVYSIASKCMWLKILSPTVSLYSLTYNKHNWFECQQRLINNYSYYDK